jgi:hypothetical protein
MIITNVKLEFHSIIGTSRSSLLHFQRLRQIHLFISPSITQSSPSTTQNSSAVNVCSAHSTSGYSSSRLEIAGFDDGGEAIANIINENKN